tara:strand:- start:170 stop:691 length:522 start_codon:yes stop_codon:yes gene_type:complete
LIEVDIQTVCLGMLSEQEASGYELKKQFESSFGCFYSASYGSIYPALSNLLKQRMVQCYEIPQEGRPNKKVYRITDDGRQHLHSLLSEPNLTHKVRSEFLVTLFFAHLMSKEQIDLIIDNQLKALEDQLAELEKTERACAENWSHGKRFALGCGRVILRAAKEYIEENRRTLI